MIRRTLLAAVALSVIGGIATPALADVVTSDSHNDYVCVLGKNSTNGVRDGVCIWFPGRTQ